MLLHLTHPEADPVALPGPVPAAGVEPEACDDTEQVSAPLRARALREGNEPLALLAYLALGAFFGLVLVESQVVSWFRIQEMFRFDSLHLYGVIGSAVAVAGVSLALIERLGLRTLHGGPIEVQPKHWGGGRIPGARYWMGGLTFGFGWALLGACPAPVFALLGGGLTVMAVALAAAMAGTWAYAAVHRRLPH